MGTAERKQRQREEVYDSILNAAWQVVKQDGWQGLSIRKIAEAIEYSIPVIYDHFENKEAILNEFSRKGFGLLNEDCRKAGMTEEEPVARVRAVARAYWNFAINNPEYYHLMYGLGMPGCDKVNQMPELKHLMEMMQEMMVALLASNGDTLADPFIKTRCFWAMLHGHVSIHRRVITGLVPADQADEVLSESINNFLAGMNYDKVPS